MRRRKWLWTPLVIALAAVLWVVFSGREKTGVEVEVQPAALKSEFRSYVTASGEIVANRYADISSSVFGRIVSLPVAEGDRVAKGQLLARLDPVQARSDLEATQASVKALEAERQAAEDQAMSARADLSRAEARSRESQLALQRVRTLNQQGVLPQADLDSATAAAEADAAQVEAAQALVRRAEQSIAAAERRIAQARAQLSGSQDLLSKTEIRSPLDGLVTRLDVREGEQVVIGIQNQPGTRLMTISDLAEINAEVKVAEAEILRVENGQSATVTLEALPDTRFEGRVIQVGASSLPTLGTTAAREFKVVIRIQDPESGLRPGLTCDAEVLVARLENVVTAPLQAVVLRDREGREETGVFLFREGMAVFQPVRAGVIGGLDIVIDGVDADAPLIVGPYQALRDLQDGDLVRKAKP